MKTLVRNLEMIRGYNIVKARFTKPKKYNKDDPKHEEKLQKVRRSLRHHIKLKFHIAMDRIEAVRKTR